MSAAQEAAVRRWYRWNLLERREDWERVPDHVPVRGMIFRGREIREGDGHTNLARFARRTGLHPLVRLTLPNQITIGRHRLIQRVVQSEGGQVLLLPEGVEMRADILSQSIEVVNTTRIDPKEPFRASEQLIKARVQIDLGWGLDRKRNYMRRREERDAYFLSGYDRNERRLSYFFCELPPGVTPSTVAEAYEMLKPPSVLAAEKQRVKVRRQGDMFLIAMPRKWRPPQQTIQRRQYVHGTNHLARECAHVDGLTMIRGPLWHRPAGRRADHHALHLGRRWWLCVKNTVPVNR